MSELAKDGEEAIKLYKNAREAKAPFDAVILDLFIENCIGGRETLNALRRIDPDVKAIISSGTPMILSLLIIKNMVLRVHYRNRLKQGSLISF